MSGRAYYNEIDKFAANWLRQLITAGHIAPGDVDERSIVDVRPDDLAGYSQHHFFAGIGGWSHALRLAGWDDARPVWTGSCPCQPFSAAGKRKGFSDDRHLWPTWARLIGERRPAIVFGEQVASAADWLRLVRGDLEALGYAVGAVPVQAASAGADHLRDRFFFVAKGASQQVGTAGQSRQRGDVAHAELPTSPRQRPDGREILSVQEPSGPSGTSYVGDEWVVGADGKARRVKPGVRLLVDGFPSRVGLLRGFGNAIDPRPASEFIGAYLDHERERVAA